MKLFLIGDNVFFPVGGSEYLVYLCKKETLALLTIAEIVALADKTVKEMNLSEDKPAIVH